MGPSRPVRRQILRLGLAAASGTLLFLSDYPVHAVALQLVAFLPVLWALGPLEPGPAAAAALGIVLGFCYSVPLLAALEFPLGFAAPLAAYQMVLWAAFAFGARAALRRPGPFGPLAAAAIAVLLQWVDFTLVPVWGTAQSFVRVWTAVPWAAQLAALTGLLGIAFVVVAAQALLVALADRRGSRPAIATALGLVVAATLTADGLLWRRSSSGSVRVAALGWVHDFGKSTTAFEVLASTYEPLLSRAAAAGAKLVVSPEAGFALRLGEREGFLSRLTSLAQHHGAMLAIGYLDPEHHENRVALVGATGELLAEYTKTHLIPFMESYRAGHGARIRLPLEGARVGAMVCQDDNFTDLARGYGRDGVQLLAVPTNDWAQVRRVHLENSLFRPIESGYGIVRAASNGISAIATARGEVLAQMDHVESGAGFLVADLPLYRGTTLYSIAGDWPAVAAALLLAVTGLSGRGRERHP